MSLLDDLTAGKPVSSQPSASSGSLLDQMSAGAPLSKGAGPISSAATDVMKTYTGDIGGAWDKLKSDFVAANPNPNFRNEGFWNQMKDQFHGLVGTGMIPVDAFNLVISPVTAAVHAGPVKAVAAGERALLGALPGGNKSHIPSQERVEGDLM